MAVVRHEEDKMLTKTALLKAVQLKKDARVLHSQNEVFCKRSCDGEQMAETLNLDAADVAKLVQNHLRGQHCHYDKNYYP